MGAEGHQAEKLPSSGLVALKERVGGLSFKQGAGAPINDFLSKAPEGSLELDVADYLIETGFAGQLASWNEKFKDSEGALLKVRDSTNKLTWR